jgi:cytochrome c peroxidase
VLPTGVTLSPVRNPVPVREDSQRETPRHVQALVGAMEFSPDGWGLLHWDGEFASIEDLIKGTFTGRNFGWLPDEKTQAITHFAQVMRGSPEIVALAGGIGLDLAQATDGQVLDAGADAVATYLKSLQFSQDASGAYNGSAYDAFLVVNRLPAAPKTGETPHEYARRLHAAVAALRAPKFIDGPAPFGELQLRGMRVFFRGTMGYVPSASAGNCAECHVPPHFTDFAFHNTGVAQASYDAVHGAGEFAALPLPSIDERSRDPVRWLPPSATHPTATGRMRRPPQANAPGQVDLGLWNVYGNPDLPTPQPAIDRQLNREGRLTKDEVLALTVGRFKTPGLRDLGQSAPYLSSGGAATIQDVLKLYQRMSELARSGKLRNAPLEFSAIRLAEADFEPLAAFLRALNEGNQAKPSLPSIGN